MFCGSCPQATAEAAATAKRPIPKNITTRIKVCLKSDVVVQLTEWQGSGRADATSFLLACLTADTSSLGKTADEMRSHANKPRDA